jgi:hypothetical protein
MPADLHAASKELTDGLRPKQAFLGVSPVFSHLPWVEEVPILVVDALFVLIDRRALDYAAIGQKRHPEA